MAVFVFSNSSIAIFMKVAGRETELNIELKISVAA